MKRSPLRWALWIIVASALPTQFHAQQSPPAISTVAYPNNSEGLRELLNNMIVVAKKGDREQLQSMVREMEIPNYETWFTATFGQEKGESWAEPYGRWLAKNEKNFEELMTRLAHTDGEFVIVKSGAMRKYDLLNNPLDGYRADWRTPRETNGGGLAHIGDFFFIEGKFRWDSTVEYSPFQKAKTGSIVPAKLVKKIEPQYPAEAKEKGVEGTVKLQIIVRKDGSVAVQNVVSGDPILSPAATDAVRQWRYEPAMLNGALIEMQTTVDVSFVLNR